MRAFRPAPRVAAALLGAAFALSLAVPPALAVDPEERLADPALEEKARDISKALRCVVCDNVSIDDSDAQVAKDMRQLVRQRVEEGLSEDEIKAEFVEYYGEYVLLKPRFTLSNLLVWAAAPLALLIGVIWMRRRFRLAPAGAEEADAATPPAPPLSEEEKKRLEALMKD